jgi:hypothetical protein
MMCPHGIYCVLSISLAGSARAALQTAHLSSPLSRQCARAARCTVLIPYVRSFPLRTETTQISGVRAYEDYMGMASNSSILPFVLGPTCRGSEPLYMPPLNYKRGGMRRRKRTQVIQAYTQHKLPQQSNTQWSRVLRSGGPNHSKSSRVHVFDDRLARQAKRLSLILILGFRAGALRHPAGEFPLRHLACRVGG